MGDFSKARDLLELSLESVASPMPAAALLRLARRTAAFNACMGLTGRLRLDGRRFVQTVEGPAEIVLSLAGSILADPRHASIRLTAFGAIAERRFDDWKDEGFPAIADAAAGGNLHALPMRPDRRRAASAAILSLGAAGRLSPLPEA